MNRLYLSGSALISLLPMGALLLEQAAEEQHALLSPIVLTIVSALSAGHVWLFERDARGLSLLAKVAWTVGLILAGAFITPLYWCLHVYLPAKMPGRGDEQPYVLLTKESNPLKAHMLKELLVAAGIDLRVHGTEDAAGIGMGQFIVTQQFKVPESQLVEAQEVLRSEPPDSEGSPELTDDEVLTESPADDTDLPPIHESHPRDSYSIVEVTMWLGLGLIALRLLDVF
jgi:hypothetical protein